MLTEPVPQSASTPRRPLGEHIAAVLDAIADGVTVQDASGHVVYANAAAAALVGLSSAAELVAGEPASVLSRFDMLDEHGAALSPHELPGRHVLSGAESREQLIQFRVHETSVERWSLVRANVMRGPSGERWVVNTFRDVTDSVQTRRRLEASELRYAQILDSVQDMVFTKSRDYVVTYANRAACEHYGMTADELRGLTDVPFNQRDFTDQYLADDREVLESGKVIEQREEPNIRHDGKPRVFHTIKAPIRDPHGNVVELVGVARDITEQRATQISSQAYQRRLELALAAGHMGVFEWDLVKNRVHWSPEVERMHGIPAGSFDGSFDAFQRDIHPDDKSHVLATVRHTIEKHDAHYLTYRIIRPDGAVRWLETHGQLELDAHGRPAHLIGVSRDITEQREADLVRTRVMTAEAAQEEAERARARIAAILDAITDPFIVLDRELRIRQVNATAARMLGRPAAEAIGMRPWEIAPDTKHMLFRTAYEKVLSTKRPLTVENFVPGRDRWFEASIYPLDDGVAAYMRDVTMRKHALELTTRLARHSALRADISAVLADERDVTKMLLRTCELLVEHLEVAFARIWTVDDAGSTLLLQASAGMYTHIDGGHGAVPIGSFKIGRIAATATPHLTNDVAHDPQVGNLEWAAKEKMVAFAGYPLIVDGKVIGVMAMFARQQLADDTMSALAGIADLVAQGLVRRRTEVELDQRLSELARSNADLEQFAYVASHDLQEPLRMVASYNQLLARRYKGKLGEDADEFIGFTVEGVTRMQRLINDLLAYSRVGTRGGERVDVDMETVFDTVTTNLGRAIADANAKITHDKLPVVVADENQMLQLLQNLIGNAVKFHADEDAKVHVGVKQDASGYTFSVRDNGIGIDPQYFERIFVIFQRLNPRETYPGTGIGLAICKKIVERHGGRIWVEAAPGKGSTVFFTLPHPRRSG